MVSGLEFLRLVFEPSQPQTPRFDPFGDDTATVSAPGYASALESRNSLLALDMGMGLRHPRPVREVELQDALRRFEQIAQSLDHAQVSESEASSSNRIFEIPAASQRRINPDALSPDDHSALPIEQRAIEPPHKSTDQQRLYRDPVCFAPIVTVGHSIWAPCPEGQWPSKAMPNGTPEERHEASNPRSPSSSVPRNPAPVLGPDTFFCLSPEQLSEREAPQDCALHESEAVPTTHKTNSIPSRVPTIPSCYSGGGGSEGENGRAGNTDDVDEDELEYISNFTEDANDDFKPDRLNFLSVLEDDFGSDEEDEEYYTASEYSEYSECFDVNSDQEHATGDESPRPPSTRPSPSSTSSKSPSSTGSCASARLTGSSVSTGASTLIDQVASPVTVPRHLRWLKGISGADVLFLDAVDRALQRHGPVLP